MQQMRKMVSQIYEHMGDETSRNIFSCKLLHSLTGDEKYMQNIVQESSVGDELERMVGKSNEKGMVIFGVGELGRWFYDCFHNTAWMDVDCFVDSNKGNESYGGVPVVKLDKYGEKIYHTLILVCSWKFHEEQCRQLLEMGVLDENIIDVVEVMYRVRNEKQYFDLPELKVGNIEEVFIDGGCYDGINSMQFAQWCKGNFRKIYAFEPDRNNFQKCEKVLYGIFDKEQIFIYNKGLGESEMTLNFRKDDSGSRFAADGEDMVEVVALDKAIKEKVTFLKLDVEGAEGMAIRGAKELIQREKPKCAICVYHKPEDIWEIPALLLEYNPDYRLYLRHYSLNGNEMVLYAV